LDHHNSRAALFPGRIDRSNPLGVFPVLLDPTISIFKLIGQDIDQYSLLPYLQAINRISPDVFVVGIGLSSQEMNVLRAAADDAAPDPVPAGGNPDIQCRHR